MKTTTEGAQSGKTSLANAEMSDGWDLLFKFIMIGDSGAGKTCLLENFQNTKFKRNATHTIGVEFGAKVLEVGGKRVKLQIWDTAGQERFKAVTRSYYRGAAGCVIVYDISNRSSFDHVDGWVTGAREMGPEGMVLLLVGNKCDLQEEREVSFVEGARAALSHKALFLETSALTGDGVREAFSKMARTVLTRAQEREIDTQHVSIVTADGITLSQLS